ncbi:thiamine biosynthesis protein ApbE [Photobacterium angustum]|uniref:FAD:protein FMN transferase n=1 Tax=Photobacterium angustum TaxID=661 RepID=A0ABX5H0J1_PHOAN|nr:FAD:protein FMN transferase [Photobacterium angustum]KJG38000.1 thiamine biosynthesis protein ApbE [Photobacterium angustum]PSX06378.1 FAD:protein FMN transferase [Photobacterium angustum]
MASYKTRFPMMGTFIDLVVHHERGEALIKECYLQLQEFTQRFTVNQAQSELMRVNNYAGIRPVRVKPDLYALIKKSKAISVDPQNPFNVAIGQLVKTWHIGFKDAKLPTDKELAEKLQLVDPSNIILDDDYQSVYLSQTGMQIDLGAIAKGYFADRIKDFLTANGVEHGFINLGGNVLTIGYSPENASQTWNVGIQNPLAASRGDICRVVPLRGYSMVTSGINERYFEYNGQRYHHLLDGKTGKPISTNIASVTIISKLSVDGEIWSTAGFLSSIDDALTYLNRQAGIEAVLISNQGDVFVTNGLTDNGTVIQLR